MKCQNCQREIPEDAKLCPYCGLRIRSTVAVPGKHSNFGIASLVLGILAACFWWIPLICLLFQIEGAEGLIFLWWLLLIMPMCVMGIILGPIAYFGEAKDNFGFLGLILCIAILVISLFFQFLIHVVQG